MKSTVKTQNFTTQIIVTEFTFLMSAVLMMAALSRVTIPLIPIPVTGQTLGVLLTGIMLGRKRAVAALITYIVMGLIGFPVFANGTFGLSTLMGPTGGYLLGFIPAAFIMGWLGEKGWYNGIFSSLAAILIGHLVIFTFGLIWLGHFSAWTNVFAAGLLPFLPGAVIKTFVAFALIPIIRK